MSNPPRRFNLSTESFAQERLTDIQDTVRALQQEYPEILCLCMFGSTVQERVREEGSDIDGYMFIDIDQLGIPEVYEMDGEGKHIEAVLLPAEQQAFYTNLIRERLKEKLEFSEERVRHIRVRPISYAIIDKLLDDSLPYATAHIAYQRALKQAEEQRRIRDQQYQEWVDGKRDSIPPFVDYPTYPDFVFTGGVLSYMFHMAIGSRLTITRFREHLIDTLLLHGEAGTFIWTKIIEGVRDFEQGKSQLPGQRHYPVTLAQAKRTYGERGKRIAE